MELNIPNLLKLKAFFEAGAPHYLVNMDIPFGLIDDPFVIRAIEKNALPVPNDCGSAGCIAGAAFQLFDPDHLQISKTHKCFWTPVRNSAMQILGLETNEEEEDFYGHDLFNPELAPDNVTAAQCAVAIQNVIDGKGPWS